MKIYIAGPMTGLPDYNYPAFNAAAVELRAAGLEVCNPAENPEPECKSWAGYMRMALAQLVTCDSIYLLKGWESSKGARIERDLAHNLNLYAIFECGASQPLLNRFESMSKEILDLIDLLVKFEIYAAEGKFSASKDARNIRANIAYLLNKRDQEGGTAPAAAPSDTAGDAE